MTLSSTIPTSRRKYLSQSELAQFANITITDTTEADDRISQAEEIIDAYVGFHDKFFSGELVGKMSSVASTTQFTLETLQQGMYEADYFKWLEIEIIGGTGAGQRRTISTSTKEGSITLTDAFTTTPDTTTYYRITQIGKFPRHCDVTYYSQSEPFVYLKAIPEEVKRAVAAQVEYLINMGDDFFTTDQSDKKSESIGDYSYSTGGGVGQKGWGQGAAKLIAPKARMLLRHIVTRVGSL